MTQVIVSRFENSCRCSVGEMNWTFDQGQFPSSKPQI
jgi:hypothetical protein